ncbi:hypothetical protein Scep_029481 [Stephania cephalantha]|uniref:Uncharacterized protein n=1 Tax=Stephania cephalantha TaxID=152367 RepID=A0AAP0HHN5_9MAGN
MDCESFGISTKTEQVSLKIFEGQISGVGLELGEMLSKNFYEILRIIGFNEAYYFNKCHPRESVVNVMGKSSLCPTPIYKFWLNNGVSRKENLNTESAKEGVFDSKEVFNEKKTLATLKTHARYCREPCPKCSNGFLGKGESKRRALKRIDLLWYVILGRRCVDSLIGMTINALANNAYLFKHKAKKQVMVEVIAIVNVRKGIVRRNGRCSSAKE